MKKNIIIVTDTEGFLRKAMAKAIVGALFDFPTRKNKSFLLSFVEKGHVDPKNIEEEKISKEEATHLSGCDLCKEVVKEFGVVQAAVTSAMEEDKKHVFLLHIYCHAHGKPGQITKEELDHLSSCPRCQRTLEICREG